MAKTLWASTSRQAQSKGRDVQCVSVRAGWLACVCACVWRRLTARSWSRKHECTPFPKNRHLLDWLPELQDRSVRDPGFPFFMPENVLLACVCVCCGGGGYCESRASLQSARLLCEIMCWSASLWEVRLNLVDVYLSWLQKHTWIDACRQRKASHFVADICAHSFLSCSHA